MRVKLSIQILKREKINVIILILDIAMGVCNVTTVPQANAAHLRPISHGRHFYTRVQRTTREDCG